MNVIFEGLFEILNKFFVGWLEGILFLNEIILFVLLLFLNNILLWGILFNFIMFLLDWILNVEFVFGGVFLNVKVVLWNGFLNLYIVLWEVLKLKDGEIFVDWEFFLNGILLNLKELFEYFFEDFRLIWFFNKLGIFFILNFLNILYF